MTTVLNDWEDIMKSRFKHGLELDLGSEKSESDQKVASSYTNLMKSFADHFSELDQIKPKKSRHIMVLTDSDGQIQALASITEKLQRLDVEILISAPWNVPMNSPISEEHQKLRVRGSGTTLMRQMYELAKEKKKKYVQLRPIDSARSFYVDRLKMTPDGWTPAVRYEVSEDLLPEQLVVPSGNLLKKAE